MAIKSQEGGEGIVYVRADKKIAYGDVMEDPWPRGGIWLRPRLIVIATVSGISAGQSKLRSINRPITG